MPATEIIKRRVIVAADAFAEIVVWQLPRPLEGSAHHFKYRLAYVVSGRCVLRYDNERGKGDHRHTATDEQPYRFQSPDQLMRDFLADVKRWSHDNCRT
jgi:hypothetical protein